LIRKKKGELPKLPAMDALKEFIQLKQMRMKYL
jgi:hypothetical protein